MTHEEELDAELVRVMNAARSKEWEAAMQKKSRPLPLRELYPVIGDETDDDPYCQCGNDPYEEEAASGKCASCGKELP